MSFCLFEENKLAQQQVESLEDGVESESPSNVERVAKMYSDGLKQAIIDTQLLRQMESRDYGKNFNPFSDLHRVKSCENGLNRSVHKAILAGAKATGLAAPGEYEISDIDFEQYLTGLNRYDGFNDESVVRVDILGLCKAIEAQYGGDNGLSIEQRRVANELINAFALDKTQIEVKAGVVELRMRMYLRKDYNKRYEFDYTDKYRLLKMVNLLETAFGHSGMNVSLPQFRDGFSNTMVLEPGRTKFEGSIGNHPLTVKVQTDHLRWRFTKECSDALSDFVSQHGSD